MVQIGFSGNGDWTENQISEKLKIPTKTVKEIMAGALDKLRNHSEITEIAEWLEVLKKGRSPPNPH